MYEYVLKVSQYICDININHGLILQLHQFFKDVV